MVTLLSLTVAVLVVAIVLLGYAHCANRKRLNAIEHSLNSNIQSLRGELDVVNSAAVGVGSRLIYIEKKFNGLNEKQQQYEANNVDYYAYNEAVVLAGQGIDATKIAEKCGLSEAEASLMSLFNNKSDASVTSTTGNPLDPQLTN